MEHTEKSPVDNSRRQFSLRSMMIGVTLFGVLMGFSSWLWGFGLVFCLFAIVLGVFIYAIRARQKRLKIISGCIAPLFVVGIPLFYYFGAYEIIVWECRTCCLRNVEVKIFSVTFYEKRDENFGSLANRQAKTGPHIEHGGGYLHVYRQFWGGKGKDWEHYEEKYSKSFQCW